jgi:predicted RNase H-like HicB family nuclease
MEIVILNKIKDMEKIICPIGWCDKNYSAGIGDETLGAIVATGKTLDEVKKEFKEALQFHIESMVEDGENVPKWACTGKYEIEFTLNISALIRRAEQFTSIAAIARASGINQRQLSHYARGISQPRPQQRAKILNGLHKIGQECLSFV